MRRVDGSMRLNGGGASQRSRNTVILHCIPVRLLLYDPISLVDWNVNPPAVNLNPCHVASHPLVGTCLTRHGDVFLCELYFVFTAEICVSVLSHRFYPDKWVPPWAPPWLRLLLFCWLQFGYQHTH
jgi:hypothetical protein